MLHLYRFIFMHLHLLHIDSLVSLYIICCFFPFDIYRSLEFLNDQHQGEDRVRLGRSYPDNSDEDNESNEVVITPTSYV